MAAQEIQSKRYQTEKYSFNAELTAMGIQKYCILEPEAQECLQEIFKDMDLTARAYHKLLKVGRSIADLDGMDRIGIKHIKEAVCYRVIDKEQRDIY